MPLSAVSFEKFIIPTLIVFAGISILVTFYYRPAEFEQTRMKVFLSFLGSIAVVLVGLNLLVTSLSFEYSQEFIRVSKTKDLIDKLWLYPNDLISKAKHARFEFLGGFSFNNLELYSAVKQKPSSINVSPVAILEEQNIAVVIIQAWEDFLISRSFDKTGDAVWLNNFLQWAQNPYLKNYFELLKHNYKPDTVELGILLFEYAKKLPVPTPDSNIYTRTVNKMLKDPRLIKLFKHQKQK